MTQEMVKRQPREQEQAETSAPTKTERSESATNVIEAADAMMAEIDEVLEVQSTEEKPLTLADMIREGSLLAPQAIKAFRTPQGETCALQAAYEAVKARGLVK